MKTPVRQLMIGSAPFGNGFSLLAGPCVMESMDHCLRMAESIQKITADLGIPYVFKASFDKANRSSVSSFRGPGLDGGLRIMDAIKEKLGLPVISDVHTPEQIAAAGTVLDALQIPAFLSRQTDMLIEAGKTGKPVCVKKGQFLAPWDMQHAIEKVESTGNSNIMLMERGASFGYNNLVSDMRSLAIMRGFGTPVIFDATHSAQLPGGQGSTSGGDRQMAILLARAACAAGVDGLFLEVHDQPEKALCDGPNMIPLDELSALLRLVRDIDQLVSA